MHLRVSLRDVTEGDLAIFFEDQLDEEAKRMAAFASRNREDFYAHWHKILADDGVEVKTILFGDAVAGNVVTWRADDGQRALGYWIGKPYWGKGIATAALSQFLEVVRARPLHAHVARHNRGSIRVLEKCGFVVGREVKEGDLDEFVMVLTGPAR